jgi:cytosine/adenosine deaminase-related metal-dependent hydrolase
MMGREIDLLVEDGYIVTMDSKRRILKNGAVAIDKGLIVDVGKSHNLESRYVPKRTINGQNFIVLPGLVDSHVHIGAEHLARSLAPDNAGPRWLSDWALPLYAAMTADEEHIGGQLSCLEMIRNGTTTFGEGGSVRNMEAAVAAVNTAGIRAVLAPWTWDLVRDPIELRNTTETALNRTKRFIKRYHETSSGRIQMAVSCISPNVCSDELLVKLMEIATSHALTFHFHHGSRRRNGVNEGPHGKRPLLKFAELDILAPHVRMTHMVHLDDQEIAVLISSGASVTHCPQTGLRLAYGMTTSGKFPELIEAGVRVALGTDGVNSSDNQDLFKAMQLAAGLFKDAHENSAIMPAETVLEMATIVGAQTLGLEKNIGSLEVGKHADLILLDRKCPELCPLLNVATALVYGCDGRTVHTSIVGGKIIMENREVLTLNAGKLYTEVEKIALSLVKRAGLKAQTRWPVL